jgi:nitric oxide reductase NorQ protein
MNSATRGRFRALEQPYIQDVDEEVATLDAQVNASHEVVDRGTLRKMVQFAHQTRQNENWPTRSTRNLMILCEHIEDSASPKAAVKNEVWAVAEPNQYPEDTYETFNDYL